VSTSFIAKYVLCPYYRKEEGVKICCEGVEDGTSIHMVFPSSRRRKDYQVDKCCDNYKKCLVFAMIDHMWEERLK
jgi:hypothetical protein